MKKQSLVPYALHAVPRPGDREVCYPTGKPPVQRALREEADLER